MKKHLGKALAMAVMMSVLAGQAFASNVRIYGNLDSTTYTGASKGQVVLTDDDDKQAFFRTDGIFFNNGVVAGLKDGGINSTSTNAVTGKEVYTALQGYVEKGTVDSTATDSYAIGSGSSVKAGAKKSVAVGYDASVDENSNYSVAVGYKARVHENSNNSVAVGYANVYSPHGTALGIGAMVALRSENSTAVGSNSYVSYDSNNSDAFGASTSVAPNLSYAVALGSESKATEAKTVSVGNDTLKRKITNVAEGDITSATSTEAVTGGQIYTMTNVAKGNYIAAGTDVADNLTALDTQVKINADDIASLKTSKADKTYVDTELAKKANAADVYTKSQTDAAIAAATYDDTAIKADIAKKADKATSLAGYGITDGATKTELNAKADKTALDNEAKAREQGDKDTLAQANQYTDQEIAKISGGASSEALEKLDSKINQTNDRVDRVGATAAALAGIHYQPMAKGQSQVAVGMGGYKGKKATALGLAYQISDRISGSVAGAANGSEHMFNVGFNYLFGQHSNKDIAQCAAIPGSMSLKEAELQAQVDSQNATIKAMLDTMNKMQARIDALEKK